MGMTGSGSGLNGQTPRCSHFVTVPSAEPGSPECARCLALGLSWARLLACLTCGGVACSDDSPGGHAREHYEETDHPVAAALGADSPWRWCYVHERTV
ncbi:UBP-type zinc finger domain-containing protein [Planotetraspora sp. GP83]|uniref:UBP-type zinc finger domain-containing protein n=1 Tax=Planotetraspora sp. GP83 TaxID=3156264 RepID=UPI003513D3C2